MIHPAGFKRCKTTYICQVQVHAVGNLIPCKSTYSSLLHNTGTAVISSALSVSVSRSQDLLEFVTAVWRWCQWDRTTYNTNLQTINFHRLDITSSRGGWVDQLIGTRRALYAQLRRRHQLLRPSRASHEQMCSHRQKTGEPLGRPTTLAGPGSPFRYTRWLEHTWGSRIATWSLPGCRVITPQCTQRLSDLFASRCGCCWSTSIFCRFFTSTSIDSDKDY